MDNTYKKAELLYHTIPDYIKEDLFEAMSWAKTTLTELEGDGHHFDVFAQEGEVGCCFAKPEWGGDHCGRPMESAAEAVVMAVCEYLSGC